MNKVSIFIILGVFSSCVSIESQERSSSFFSVLKAKELSDFERLVTVNLHEGRHDDATKLGENWIAFANCEPLLKNKFETNIYGFLNATLVAETARRELHIVGNKGRVGFFSSIGEEVMDPAFFTRDASQNKEVIHWPESNEHWKDETPAARQIKSQCGDYSVVLFEKEKDYFSKKKNKKTTAKSWWEERYYQSIVEVVHAAEKLKLKEKKGAISNTIFKTNLEGIRYFSAQRRRYSSKAQFLRLESEKSGDQIEQQKIFLLKNNALQISIAEYNKKITYLAEALEKLVPVEKLEFKNSELSVAKTVLAMIAVERGDYHKAKRILASLDATFTDAQYAWLSRYLNLRVLSSLGKYQMIRKKFDISLPPVNSKYFGPYVYRIALAFREANDEERFFGVVKSAFRDKAYKSDPFLRALYFEYLRVLSSVIFDLRVTEVLEELGPRGETFERVEQLARIALDEGYPENADAAATWLLGHHKNAKFHPRYEGIRAISAFQLNDSVRFQAALKRIVYRPLALKDAIAKDRQPVFFRHADIELSRVLERMIPEMAEWGNSKNTNLRRQKWLKLIVKQAQDFLHNDRESLVRHQLLEVYRLASGLLKEDPRGYAERVGETKLRPIVLGNVKIEPGELAAFEPGIDLGISRVFSTTLIPEDLPFQKWQAQWASRRVK